ncbi:MAG: anaerobic sulfatase maturase [Oceanospirillaceae bacterium]|nr:anaerobic sulfatase maturase [Oceanospirillaceae bacterium]
MINLINISDLNSTVEKSPFPYRIVVKPIGPICNLDCEYCFYLDKEEMYPKKHSFRMKDEVLERLIHQYIESQPVGVKEINFAWQGGEPTLLGVDFFKRVVALQKYYQRPGTNITNAMQTNGTLLNDEWGEFLAENNFLIGISVDGNMKLHDKLRKTKTGQGSYDQVKRGINILKKYKVEHNFLCVINSVNGEQPSRVYQALKKLGAEHIQFIPIVEHEYLSGDTTVDSKTRVSKNSVKPKMFGQFLNEVFHSWYKEDVGKVFIRNFEDIFAKLAGVGGSMCVHAEQCGKNIAIEHDGKVYSCDHFVFDDYYQGNLMEQSLSSLVTQASQVTFGENKKNQMNQECFTCEYRQLCHGGCPAHRIVKDGADYHKNYLCEGYKYFYRNSSKAITEVMRSL